MEWGTPVQWGKFLLFCVPQSVKTKETSPTRPGSLTPCKQALRTASLTKAVIAYESLWNCEHSVITRTYCSSFPLSQDIKAVFFVQILKAFFHIFILYFRFYHIIIYCKIFSFLNHFARGKVQIRRLKARV